MIFFQVQNSLMVCKRNVSWCKTAIYKWDSYIDIKCWSWKICNNILKILFYEGVSCPRETNLCPRLKNMKLIFKKSKNLEFSIPFHFAFSSETVTLWQLNINNSNLSPELQTWIFSCLLKCLDLIYLKGIINFKWLQGTSISTLPKCMDHPIFLIFINSMPDCMNQESKFYHCFGLISPIPSFYKSLATQLPKYILYLHRAPVLLLPP
jgi:hypothetical protein